MYWFGWRFDSCVVSSFPILGMAGNGWFCGCDAAARAQLLCGGWSGVAAWNSIAGLNGKGLYRLVLSSGSGKSNSANGADASGCCVYPCLAVSCSSCLHVCPSLACSRWKTDMSPSPLVPTDSPHTVLFGLWLEVVEPDGSDGSLNPLWDSVLPSDVPLDW